MTDVILLFGLLSVLNWAIVDIYFHSIVFDSIRAYSVGWEQSKGFWRYFRYMLDCPFCFSHWTASAVLAFVSAISYLDVLPLTLNPILAGLLVPAVARTSLVLRDYSLPPLTNTNGLEIQSETTIETPHGIETKTDLTQSESG